MPDGPNYLLGRGENLTIPIDPRSGGGPKHDPYSFAEAKQLMEHKASETSQALDQLPPLACPADQAVAILTLHPAYLAKSYFPNALLAAVGLRSVGSRAATIVPRKPSKGAVEGSPAGTTELFVAGPRHRFQGFARAIAGWAETSDGASDLIKIEDFRAPRAEERIRPFRSDDQTPLMEVALHGAGLPLATVLDGFRAFVGTLGDEVEMGRPLVTGPLLFLPLRIPRGLLFGTVIVSPRRLARPIPA